MTAMTCWEAARRVQREADTTVFEHDMHRLEAVAAVLHAMGETPVTQNVFELYPFLLVGEDPTRITFF